MTTFIKNIKPINNKTLNSRFSISTLAVCLMAINVSAHADQSIVAMSVTETSADLTQLRLDFDSAPVKPVAYQTDTPPQLVLDFNNVDNGLPSRHSNISQGAINKVTTISNEETTRLIIDLNNTNQNTSSAPNFATQVVGNSLLLNISSGVPQSAQTQPTNTPSTYMPPSQASTAQSHNQENALTSQSAYASDTQYSPVNSTSSTPSYANQDYNYQNGPIVIGETRGTFNAPYTSNTSSTSTPQMSASQTSASQTSVTQTDVPQTMVVRVNPLLNPASAQQTAQQYDYTGLTAIDYSASDNGGGNVSISLTNPSIPVDVQRQGNKIVVRMTGATVPSDLLRRMNIGSGLVTTVDTNNQGKNGILTINMAGDFEYQAYQSNNQLNLSIKPPELLREPTIEEKVYTGEPLSIEFQDMPIRRVLDVLAEFTEMNIVVSDSVSGNLTLRLYEVPWDQALDIILRSKNLDKRENGNVILIAPATELAQQEASELEQQQKVETFLPLRTEYIRLSYANAEDVLTLISSGRNSGGDDSADTGSLLSGRGTVTTDQRTNTLIVQDTSQSIENIRALIEQIDIPVRQVMIEARIVRANDNFSKDMGVKWGILSDGAASNRNLLVGSNINNLDSLRDFSVETSTINGQEVSYPSYNISGADNLNVDLGASGAAGRIAFGLISMSELMIDLELSAMQADQRGEVISTPKILTMDKQTARVSAGTQIPYQEAAASGATAVSFVEASLSLEATPNITPDGRIGLELNIENGTPRILNGSVAIDIESVQTNVIVEDGQTIVLGGIFSNTISTGSTKVPFLGDLPYVGKLFRRDTQQNDKQELLIFVTPKLINDGVSRIN